MKLWMESAFPGALQIHPLGKTVSVVPQTGLLLWWPLEVDLTVGKGTHKGFLTQILLY